MPDFNIRSATVNDAAAIAYVRHDGWRKTYRGILSDEYLNSMNFEQGTALWSKILQAGQSVTDVMLNDNGKVIGFVNAGRNNAPEVKCEGEIRACLKIQKAEHLFSLS